MILCWTMKVQRHYMKVLIFVFYHHNLPPVVFSFFYCFVFLLYTFWAETSTEKNFYFRQGHVYWCSMDYNAWMLPFKYVVHWPTKLCISCLKWIIGLLYDVPSSSWRWIIIIIIILVITFLQGIYNYVPETNHVSRVHNVAAVLYLQFVLHVMLPRPWNMFFTSTSALPAVIVQCPIWLFL